VALASQPPNQVTSFLFKRRRCFPLGQADRNEAINFPAQSSASDLMNFGLERCMMGMSRFHRAFPLLQVHDAAIFECDEDDADALAAHVKESFTQEYEVGGITIPFPIDLKIARSWADV
jgi:DNA polymerase I-like protein with 3'-5' exonuclease and polymerase domains